MTVLYNSIFEPYGERMRPAKAVSLSRRTGTVRSNRVAAVFGDFTGFCARVSSGTCYRSCALIPMRPAHPTSSHGRLARRRRVVTRRINFRRFYRVRRVVRPPGLYPPPPLSLSPKSIFITLSLPLSQSPIRPSLSVALPSTLVAP